MVRSMTSSRANCRVVLGLTLCKQREVLDSFAGVSVFAKLERLFMARVIVLSCPYFKCFLIVVSDWLFVAIDVIFCKGSGVSMRPQKVLMVRSILLSCQACAFLLAVS
jgi:hypothetical protein